jgi:hypothetical protein
MMPSGYFRKKRRCDSSTHQTHDQADNENDQENEEQDFRDLGRTRGNATKAEYRGDDRYDEKYGCSLKHDVLLVRAGTCPRCRFVA